MGRIPEVDENLAGSDGRRRNRADGVPGARSQKKIEAVIKLG
jgi:hypothetical protein